jgi:thiamine phosphate synthase YjbQ (UPF0047 family)
MKEQLIRAIDGISMAAYTGNVIVTGDEGMDSVGLAKNIIREVQMSDSNFSGKIAKISGDTLNTRDVKQIIDGLNNGALIIQKASRMNEETVKNRIAQLTGEIEDHDREYRDIRDQKQELMREQGARETELESQEAELTSIQDEIRRLIPTRVDFKHQHDTPEDAAGHVKSTLIGPSMTFIIENGELLLGHSQGIYFLEFDGPRNRECIVKILEEK